MSTLKVLEEYLVGDGGYLLNNDNNDKVVMLSGAWGSGKTHFWQEKIEPELKKKLKDKISVYVSLYGQESLDDIKSTVYLSASGKNLLSSEVSTFGVEALSSIKDSELAIGKAIKAGKGLYDSHKKQKGISKLKKGGLVCFDDFERKSKNVDLNDLFGFISQLALNHECKVVVILNSDVFEGEEANIFRTVKEKTVSKYFYFEPTMDELFETIINSSEHYQRLEDYKVDIFKAINETKELNARIYLQVLDNCLEWLKHNEYNLYEVRALILTTVNFLKHHFVFEYRILKQRNNSKLYAVLDKFYQDDALLEFSKYFTQTAPQISPKISQEEFEEYLISNRDELSVESCKDSSEFLHMMHSSISEKKITKKDDKEIVQTESYYESIEKVFYENKDTFKALYHYAYFLNVEYGVDEEKFDEINQFVKTGILSN